MMIVTTVYGRFEHRASGLVHDAIDNKCSWLGQMVAQQHWAGGTGVKPTVDSRFVIMFVPSCNNLNLGER